MDHILYEKKGKIAYITLNRPEKLNALGLQATKELIEIWKNFRDDSKVWVGILSGKGKSFCPGADVGAMRIDKDNKWTIDDSLILGKYPIGPYNYRVWKPLIGAVHRHVLGLGFYLALQCDFRIASEDAQFGMPEPMVGIPTLFAHLIRDYLPHGYALEMLLLAKRINAQKAYEMGLVKKVVKPEKLMSTAQELAEKLCEKGPLSLRAIKEVYYRSRDIDNHSALALVEHVLGPVMNSEDAAEGKKAFMEKRKAIWKGK